MVKSHVSVPGLVAWDVIRGTNSSIVCKKGVTFARNNLNNTHSYKFSLAQPTVNIELGADKKTISLISARGVTVLKGAKDAEEQVRVVWGAASSQCAVGGRRGRRRSAQQRRATAQCAAEAGEGAARARRRQATAQRAAEADDVSARGQGGRRCSARRVEVDNVAVQFRRTGIAQSRSGSGSSE